MKIYEFSDNRGRYCGVIFRQEGRWVSEDRNGITRVHETSDDARQTLVLLVKWGSRAA